MRRPQISFLLGIIIGLFTSLSAASAQTSYIALTSVAWSPDGTMIAGAGLDILRIWDATKQSVIADLQGIEPGHVNFSVSWSPDSQKLVSSADDFLVRVWNITDPNYAVGQLLGTISPPPEDGFLWFALWSPDGQSIATGMTKGGYTLQMWDAKTYALTSQFSSGWIRKMSWYQNDSTSKIAVVNQDSLPRFQPLDSTRQRPIVVGDKRAAADIEWNSSGDQLAVSYVDGLIKVWDTDSGTEITAMTGAPADYEGDIVWSPDDTKIASASDDSAIRIWNSATGQLLQVLPTIQSVGAVDFSPDGSQIAYGGENKSIEVVALDSSEFLTPTPSINNSNPIGTQTP